MYTPHLPRRHLNKQHFNIRVPVIFGLQAGSDTRPNCSTINTLRRHRRQPVRRTSG